MKEVPTSKTKRLAFVASALAAPFGNVIYANGADDAEKMSLQLYDLVGATGEAAAESPVRDLSDLVKATIHGQYLLATVLQRRIAFHYGNMPLLVRSEIERLFDAGEIHYLVCTSTLIEGVNLSRYRFPGHSHSVGEYADHEVSWEKNVEPLAPNSSAMPLLG